MPTRRRRTGRKTFSGSTPRHAYLPEGIHGFARFHLDWQTWLAEKLVDTLVIQCHHGMAPEHGLPPFAPGIHERGGRLVWFAPVGRRALEWGQTAAFAERIAVT